MKLFVASFDFADADHCFKGDDNMNKGLFRSALSISSKLYENILNNQMFHHFLEISNA